jgi:hypothetical protein
VAEKIIEMEAGKIYYISFGGTQLVARFKESDITQYYFFAHLHYLNGYENFHKKGYCTYTGIEEIRRATPAERHNLLRFEIENDTI